MLLSTANSITRESSFRKQTFIPVPVNPSPSIEKKGCSKDWEPGYTSGAVSGGLKIGILSKGLLRKRITLGFDLIPYETVSRETELPCLGPVHGGEPRTAHVFAVTPGVRARNKWLI